MDFLTFLAIALSVTNAGLGLLVFFKNGNKSLSRTFLLFTISSVVWVGGLALIQEGLSQFSLDIPTIGLRIAFAGAAFVGLFFLLFTTVFPEKKELLNKYTKVALVVAGILIALVSVLTKGIVYEVNDYLAFGYNVEYGAAYPLYVGYILIVFWLAFRILIKRYKEAKGIEKIQLKYFLIGGVLSIIPVIITNLLIPTITGTSLLSKVGPLFISMLVISVTYAITKHQLFNIRIIATEIFTSLFVLIFLINFFLSESARDYLVNGILLLFTVISGVLLIRGTVREISALQELSEKKSEFLSIASHQLRTPVTIMKGYLSMMREGSFGKMDGKQLTVVNKAYRTNEEMLGLINDFLNLSRAEKGTLEYLFAKRDMVAIINGIVTGLKPAAETKKITLNWHKPAESIFTYVDQTKITQVISNFIDNAIKYTPEGGGISINIEKEGPFDKTVRVYVKDNGIGIKKDEIESIFGSFERGDTGKKINATGTGLGLYVAKMIIEGHNGKIWAESEGEGKGSTFIIELPVKQPKVNQ